MCFLCYVCKTSLSIAKLISPLHCEFMSPAVGSGVVQAEVLITSNVSHCCDSVGKGRKRLAMLPGWALTSIGGLGLFIRGERCSDCPVARRCKKHKPKPTQNTESTNFEYTDSQLELDVLSGLISCIYPSY